MDRWERVLCRRTARQYGAGEEVSLHQLTCLLCATVLGSDAPATADPRLLLQPDGAAVDPQAFLAALSTHEVGGTSQVSMRARSSRIAVSVS